MDPSPSKILVVDDVEDNLEILRDLLSFHGHRVETANGGKAALEMVQQSPPDLILLDILMPHMDGFEVCQHLKADEATDQIPVIFVSSMSDLESKVRGFKVGGVDYVNKPYQHAEILARVNTQITMLRLRKSLEEKNLELERLANTDTLTELYNRRRFFFAAEAAFSNAYRNNIPFSITMLDVDYFKRINDNYGHVFGDQVLSHVARLIQSQTRTNDLVARYGGEEFVILHPTLSKEDTYEIAEEIRSRVETTPYTGHNEEINVTLSAGVVDVQDCRECHRIDDVLKCADQALYQAKNRGRNQVVVFEPMGI